VLFLFSAVFASTLVAIADDRDNLFLHFREFDEIVDSLSGADGKFCVFLKSFLEPSVFLLSFSFMWTFWFFTEDFFGLSHLYNFLSSMGFWSPFARENSLWEYLLLLRSPSFALSVATTCRCFG